MSNEYDDRPTQNKSRRREGREIVNIYEMATMLCTTEAAIRSAIARRSRDIPPSFVFLGKHTWRRESVRKFLQEREEVHIATLEPLPEPKKRGRPRLVPMGYGPRQKW